MAITPRRMVSGSQLTTSAATYYTATNVKAQIQALTLTNTSAGAVTVTVYLVPDGGTAGDSNTVLDTKSINAGESYKVIEAIGQWLEAGGTIQALASSATAITLVASGIEYS